MLLRLHQQVLPNALYIIPWGPAQRHPTLSTLLLGTEPQPCGQLGRWRLGPSAHSGCCPLRRYFFYAQSTPRKFVMTRIHIVELLQQMPTPRGTQSSAKCHRPIKVSQSRGGTVPRMTTHSKDIPLSDYRPISDYRPLAIIGR